MTTCLRHLTYSGSQLELPPTEWEVASTQLNAITSRTCTISNIYDIPEYFQSLGGLPWRNPRPGRTLHDHQRLIEYSTQHFQEYIMAGGWTRDGAVQDQIDA